MTGVAVALGARLAGVPWVKTLGIRPNLEDYPLADRELILAAPIIYYPTHYFAVQMCAMGKRIFPSLTCHQLQGDKIKQTTLFKLRGVPHPRTRVYFHRQRQRITREWHFPFVAKTPRFSGRGEGVFLIEGPRDLARYLDGHPVAYIQRLLPRADVLRVVVLNYRSVVAYWRRPPPGEWRANVHVGASISFDDLPADGIRLAEEAARACDLDEVGLDLARSDGQWYVLEANMKYGTVGLREAGVDPAQVVGDMIAAGEI